MPVLKMQGFYPVTYKVPQNMDDLMTLAGVGRKSANVIMLEAFGNAKRYCC